MKAGRNKTIDISVEEGREYLQRCMVLEKSAEISEILDKTIQRGFTNSGPTL